MKLFRHLAVLATLLASIGLAPDASAQDAANPITRDAVLRDPEIPAMGNPQGDVTVVEWFDYQCPYCKKTAPVLARIAREDGKVRLVHKDWPIFGEVSFYAARMVLAAKYQGKYAAAHDAVIAAPHKLSEDAVRQLLAEAGVDVVRASTDLEANRKAIEALLERNNQQAEALGFNGTPSFIIGTFRVPGVLQEAGFRQAIADARRAAAPGSGK